MKTESIKMLLLILFTLLLINPVVIVILKVGPIVTILLPLFSIVVVCLLYQIKILNFLLPYYISLLLALSILIHAEIIFICNFKDYVIEDLYTPFNKYYFNRPWLKKTFNDKEYAVSYYTNEQGFRIGKEDNPDTEISECDWLFLGDSYTQGAQVEYEDLYTSKLYQLFPHKVIINSGISGWGIPEELNYYLTEGHKLKAKKVFLQICNFNDFMHVHEKERSFTDILMTHSHFLRFLLYPFKYANPAELPLGRWTEPFYPTSQDNQDFNIFYRKKSDKQMKDLKNFTSFLNRLNESVKQNGAELIVFQIPSKEQLYFKYFEEVMEGFKIDPSQLDMNFPNDFLSRICAARKIKYLDLTIPLGSEHEEVFYRYDEHFNATGHSRVSEIIAKFINQQIDSSFNTIEFLSNHNSEDRYPISNDTNLVSFQSIRDSNIELFIGDSLLNNSTRITFNNVDELHPWIDIKQKLIYFTEGEQSEGITKVASMSLDGSNRKYLTKEGFFGAIPSLNKDLTKIVYPEWTVDAGKLTNPKIVLIDLMDGSKRTITDDKYESWRPVFSPDDSKLFYISKRDDQNFDVFQYDFVSNIETNLTRTPFDEWDPFISPDGLKIVYAGFKDKNWDIFLLNIEDGKSYQLTNTIGNEWDTSFSLDGKYIYYAGTFGFMNGIYRMKLDFPKR